MNFDGMAWGPAVAGWGGFGLEDGRLLAANDTPPCPCGSRIGGPGSWLRVRPERDLRAVGGWVGWVGLRRRSFAGRKRYPTLPLRVEDGAPGFLALRVEDGVTGFLATDAAGERFEGRRWLAGVG